ncbi:tyrosinase family oxidase copper chaperone [Streptomyces sp. NPDC017202]|uniref:tyrosinase family oxidase copper chaperone n=1 Tax=Streptomyces sp. NPDC017202 TaxID=3364981 RepID=UPI00379EB613
MVVSVDGTAAVTTAPAQPPRRTTRRDALRGLFAAAAALALTPLVAASRPARRRDGPGPAEAAFDETYLGRHLLGRLVPPADAADAADAAGAGRWEITVDGRPLHLMRRADGTWLSMVDHYRSYASPLDAARAAVDELGPGQMLRAAATGRHTHLGGHHGLHP